MPKMDGKETLRALKKLDPDIRIQVTSGYSLNGKAGEIEMKNDQRVHLKTGYAEPEQGIF